MKRLAIMATITALAIPVAIAEGSEGSEGSGCLPGEWVTVRVTGPNGDRSITELRAQLPEGHYLQSNDGVEIHADGRVVAPKGATVECIAPTGQ